MESKQERIKRLKAEIEQLEKESSLKVRVWYKHKAGGYWIWKDEHTMYGFTFDMEWLKPHNKRKDSTFLSFLTTASDEEVEKVLREEASRRGYKEGVKVITLDRGERTIDEYDEDNIDFGMDYPNSLNYGNKTIFRDGVWAEIIKEPEFKVGDLVVVLPEDDHYFNSYKNEVGEITNLSTNTTWIDIRYKNGNQNNWEKVRHATEQEIEEYRKTVLFTTEDGVEIKEGMSYWCVNTASHLLSLWMQTAKERTQLAKTVKAFYDEDKARAFQKTLLKLPKLNGYEGKDVGTYLKWGCYYIPKKNVKRLISLRIKSFTLEAGGENVIVTEEIFNQIKEYINKSK